MGELISVAEAARRLGVSAVTASSWIERGWLPATRIGSRFYVGRRWIERQIREANGIDTRPQLEVSK